MAGQRTNETDGTRAILRNTRTSAFKIREVLDLVRGMPVGEARDLLRFSERDAADLVLKLLDSAVANAENNDGMVPDELFVSSCFADEGRTQKTFRPRARGRAGRLRKRSAHITIIVSRLPESRLGVVKAKQERAEAGRRSRRVTASQQPGGRRARVGRGRGQEAEKGPAAPAEAEVDDLGAGAEEIVDQQAPSVEAAAVAATPAEPAESTDADAAQDEEK
ncbi:MAG: 50S ribosomal protein L22 [Acidimicrobiales bacterium]